MMNKKQAVGLAVFIMVIIGLCGITCEQKVNARTYYINDYDQYDNRYYSNRGRDRYYYDDYDDDYYHSRRRDRTTRGVIGGAATGAVIGGIAGGGRGAGYGALGGAFLGGLIGSR